MFRHSVTTRLFFLLLVAPTPQFLLGAPPPEVPAAPAAPFAADPAAPEHKAPKPPKAPKPHPSSHQELQKSAQQSHEVSLPELPEDLSLSDLEPRPPPPPAITDVKNPRCTDYYCSIELCLPIEDCDGIVIDNATECGCCPLCIKYLDAGRACGRHGVLRFPERPTTMCRPPLTCVDGYCSEGAQSPRRGAKPSGGHHGVSDVDNAIDQ